MKKNKRIIVTLIFLSAAVIIFAGVSLYSYGKNRQECFQHLVGHTEQIAAQIRSEIEGNKEYLLQFSGELSQYDLDDIPSISGELTQRGDIGLLSEAEVLLPGNQLILGDGTVRDVTGQLSFDELKEQEEFITKRTSHMDDPSRQIIRHCVPITKDGEVAAILCGVIDLADLPELFRIYDYGTDYNVFVLEAATGMFIQDTWHDELLSIHDYGRRPVKPGYNWNEFDQSVSEQRADSLVFRSAKAGEYLYSYVAPVGVADWMVMINVQEPQVFAQANELLLIFLVAAILLVIVFASYFIWFLKDVRMDNREKEKQIRNAGYMLSVEKQLFDAHIYPQHIALALRYVMEYLTAEAAFLWFADDESVVQKRCWHYGRDFFSDISVNFDVLYPRIFAKMQKDKGLIINDRAALIRQFPDEGNRLVKMEIRNFMMIPVYDVDRKAIMVLGVCNLGHHWGSLQPLQQVALSFSMMINHYQSYHALQAMSTIDAMTGLLNRNSYHEIIDEMEIRKPKSLGCVYIDLNGLHEVNNLLGHKAGDQMLRTVAEILDKWFSGAKVCRIGGDEFVVFCSDWVESAVHDTMGDARKELEALKYEMSVGIEWAEGDYRVNKVIEIAEQKMRQDKEFFYQNGGKTRSLRQLNEQVELMISRKEEADAFLSVLEPEFKGVYFVNLDTDEVRHLFIPDYFKEILEESEGRFSQAILTYAERSVVKEDFHKFEQATDYDWLRKELDSGNFAGFNYYRKDGSHFSLRIVKFNEDKNNRYKTQWIFKTLQ